MLFKAGPLGGSALPTTSASWRSKARSISTTCTILAAMVLNNDRLFFEVSGRQERLTGVAGTAKQIPALLV